MQVTLERRPQAVHKSAYEISPSSRYLQQSQLLTHLLQSSVWTIIEHSKLEESKMATVPCQVCIVILLWYEMVL